MDEKNVGEREMKKNGTMILKKKLHAKKINK